MNTPVFYRDKPIFGFDLGHSTIRVVQINPRAKKNAVTGYGLIEYNGDAVKNGVLVDLEEIARQSYDLITRYMTGHIDTNRVVASLPTANTYSCIFTLPKMNKTNLKKAVMQKAEQCIPIAINKSYFDYEITHTDNLQKTSEILLVATPKTIVHSYIKLFDMLGLELSLLEANMNAVSRAVQRADYTKTPTLIIDLGSVATDLFIFDKSIKMAGTIAGGGETITELIAKKLRVTKQQSHTIKTRYGLNTSKKQDEILKALNPFLDKLLSEIRKMTKSYADNTVVERKVKQIIIVGGGANLPGLSAYLTDHLRLPTRLINPWQNLSFGELQPPHKLETTLYATAVGLALTNPMEVHHD